MLRRFIPLLCLALIECRQNDFFGGPFEVLPEGTLRTNYLADMAYIQDSAALTSLHSHLVVFNPANRSGKLDITAYYEDNEPDHFTLIARPHTSTEYASFNWPIQKGKRFALKVESNIPVVCQATIGWTNTLADYAPEARTRSSSGARETAKSYMAQPSLAKHWYYADGIVLTPNDKVKFWNKESETAVIFNPGDSPAHVTLRLHYPDSVKPYPVTVEPRRVRHVLMDDIAQPLRHYGTSFTSDQPIAVQWIRTVRWVPERGELMAFWTVPAMPVERALK